VSDAQADSTDTTQPEVIELRTHGVSGTPPASMLNASAVVQVSGDAQGRFFQAADTLGTPLQRVTDLKCGPGKAIRFREGYHWGNMTSGGLRQALWAVLLPFAMVNVAQWMVPPVNGTPGRLVVFVLRGLVRTVGLFLTMLIMVQLTVIVADVVAAQCIIGGNCREIGIVKLLRDHTFGLSVAVAVVMVTPMIAAATITRNSRTDIEDKSYNVDIAPAVHDPARPRANIAEKDFYAEEKSSPARTVHATAGLAAATLVVTGGRRPVAGEWIYQLWWWIALGLLAITVMVMFVLDDPRGTGGKFSRGGRTLTRVFDRRSNRGFGLLWWIAAVANLVLAATVTLRHQLDSVTDHRLIGIDAVVLRMAEVVIWLCVAAAVATGVVAFMSRQQFWKGVGTSEPATLPKPYRPWLVGTATAFVLPLAALLGGRSGHRCHPSGAQLPDRRVHTATSCVAQPGWSTHAADLRRHRADVGPHRGRTARRHACRDDLAGARPSRPIRRRQPDSGPQAHVVVVHRSRQPADAPDRRGNGGVGRGRRHRRGDRDEPAAAVADQARRPLGVRWATDLLTAPDGLNGWGRFFQGIGILVLGLIVLGLLWTIYNAYRRPDTAGRSLGVLWDLASFWPSEGHAFVPPFYAGNAVNDLTERSHWYLDTYPDAKLVLCGHSQGSLLMYATVLRLSRERPDVLGRVGLVTYGSQLQWAYGRGFTDMLSYFSHEDVMTLLAQRWNNIIRFTDPIGGPVLSWRLTLHGNTVSGRGLGQRPSTPNGEPVSAVAPGPGAIRLGHELWLPDPVLDEPIFPPRKHSDYTLDPRWDDAVARAAGLLS
jgi:hypothetical protein